MRGGKIVRTYTRDDGLLSDSASLLAEDADGCLWVADRAGFVRLDGDRFQPVAGSPNEGQGDLILVQHKPCTQHSFESDGPNGSHTDPQ